MYGCVTDVMKNEHNTESKQTGYLKITICGCDPPPSIISLFVSRFRRIHSALDSMLNVLIIDEGERVVVDWVPICKIIKKRVFLWCCLRICDEESF